MLSEFHAVNPYRGFPLGEYPYDVTGFGESEQAGHCSLSEIIAKVKPRTMVEVGVWKGKSAFTICEEALKYHSDFQLLAVDTWTGSSDFWSNVEDELRYKALRLENGYPTVYRQFLANVIHRGLENVITPLPLASLCAAKVVKFKRFKRFKKFAIDLVHIDAAHDYLSVSSDIDAWIQASPILFGHDYSHEPVRRAVHERFSEVSDYSPWWFVKREDRKDVKVARHEYEAMSDEVRKWRWAFEKFLHDCQIHDVKTVKERFWERISEPSGFLAFVARQKNLRERGGSE